MIVRRSLAAYAVLAAGFAALAAVPAAPGGDPGAAATRTFRLTYTVAVRDIPAGARRLSIWVPVPETDPHQEVLDLAVQSPLEYSFTREHRYGNRLLHLAADAPLPDRIDLRLEAVVARRAYRVLDAKSQPAENDRPSPKDLGPDALVPIGGEIAATARRATAGARTPLEKARAIYDYVTSTLHYDKSGEGWGRGDAVYACDAKRGAGILRGRGGRPGVSRIGHVVPPIGAIPTSRPRRRRNSAPLRCTRRRPPRPAGRRGN